MSVKTIDNRTVAHLYEQRLHHVVATIKRRDSSLFKMLLAIKTKFYFDNVDNLWLSLPKKLLIKGGKRQFDSQKQLQKVTQPIFSTLP